MFSALLVVGGGAAFWYFVIAKKNKVAPASLPLEGGTADSKWRYVHEHLGTAIGLCPSERMVRLRGKFHSGVMTKDYSYSDIREWKFNISSGGMIQTFGRQSVSSALGTGIANYTQGKKNEAETGLFLTVRDIDFPEWQVRFPPSRQREHEIKRWMEILRQELNEGGATA